MPLNAQLAGKDYGHTTYAVTAQAIEKYARATNDLNERYIGSGSIVAPPVFPVVPAFSSFVAAGQDPELGADMLRLVHAAEEHVLYGSIRPGEELTVTSTLESVDRSDAGDSFTVKAIETDRSGQVIAEVRGTMFIRGSGSRAALRGAAAEEPAPDDIVYEETTAVDDDQPLRYAEASGDHNPIHLDEAVARKAGLRGTILHGMCTMAIATKAAVNGLAHGDPSRVSRVAVSFSRAVLPGQELTTRFWQETLGEGGDRYGFETYNPNGRAVIKNGQVEIR
ncbi:MAG: MaoC family dehydratase N-terminal domain-containing protein [Actinomycetota bacterium]|nr:MaoC family dehydratase N-terminal domain-containing protein [Actinomycetota bacterium]